MSSPLAAPSLSRRSIAARLFVSPTRHLAAPSPRFLDSRLLLYGLRCSATVCLHCCLRCWRRRFSCRLVFGENCLVAFPCQIFGRLPWGSPDSPPLSPASFLLFFFFLSFFFFLPENWLGKAVVRPIIFCSCHRIRVLIHPVVPSVPRRGRLACNSVQAAVEFVLGCRREATPKNNSNQATVEIVIGCRRGATPPTANCLNAERSSTDIDDQNCPNPLTDTALPALAKLRNDI